MAAAARRRASPRTPHPRAVAAAHGRVVRLAPFWRRRAHEVIEAESHRRDHRANLHAYVEALALAARGDGTSTLTRAAAAELLGVDTRTVSRLRGWLAERHLLTTLEHGSTPATRRADPDEGNRCAVYVLTVLADAPLDETALDPLSHNGYGRNVTPPLGSPRGRERTAGPAPAAPLDVVCAAASVSRRWLQREVEAAGLGGLAEHEVVHVLRWHPDGTRWSFGPGTRRPVGAVRWMLRTWASFVVGGDVDSLRAHMPVVLDPVAAAAAAADRWSAGLARQQQRHAEQAARRAADAAERAAATPMPAWVRAEVEARRAQRQQDNDALTTGADTVLGSGARPTILWWRSA